MIRVTRLPTACAAALTALAISAFLANPAGASGTADHGTAAQARSASGSDGGACGRGPGSIPPSKIGINLVSVWNEIFGGFPPPDPPLTAEQINANFWTAAEALSRIGYRGIENVVFPGSVSGVYADSTTAMRLRLKRLGLETFANWSLIDPATYPSLLQQAVELGAQYAGGEPSGFQTLPGALAQARTLNELGRLAARRGLKLQAHNHAPAFTTRFLYDADRDGDKELTSAQEVMMLNTDRRYVTWEIDIHHALVAFGKDNRRLAAFLQRYDEQIEVIHVKGTTATADEAIDQSDFTAVGNPDDVTDWPRILRALDHISYYVYEWDFPADGIAEARASYQYLRSVRF